MPKMKLEFDGLDALTERLTKLGGDTKKTAEDALKKSKRYVHKELGSAMDKHNKTYATIKSLDSDSGVEWAGDIGTIHVGFNIHEGGLASIFLMYGTPRMKKDQNLYNAIYGTATRAQVQKIQEDTFYEALRKL